MTHKWPTSLQDIDASAHLKKEKVTVLTNTTYHQVNVIHYTSVPKLNTGPLKSADVGFHLNCSRQDAVGKLIVHGRVLTEQPENYIQFGGFTLGT